MSNKGQKAPNALTGAPRSGPGDKPASGEFPEPFGRYTILQRVAVGGMAEILLAIEDTPHAGKRFVTIKRIRPEHKSDPDYIDFFISEGRVAMQCSHPNLTRSFDLDTVDGVHYLAMEYIRGHTLLDLIRASYRQQKYLSVGTSMRVASEVAAALEHLHGMRDVEGLPMNVVHRDVTPQNIMITASGSVKLIDLGIARSEVQVHQTRAGTVKGKLSYIAPEQLVGKHTFDQRADIFSLGVVLHETLTTRGLFRGQDDADTLERVRTMPIPIVSALRNDVPPELDVVLEKALDRRLDCRYQNASEFLRALDGLADLSRAASVTETRDEVLALCGDPPVPTLGGESFSVLRTALKATSWQAGKAKSKKEAPAPPADPSMSYFLERAGLNVREAKVRQEQLRSSDLHNALAQAAESSDKP